MILISSSGTDCAWGQLASSHQITLQICTSSALLRRLVNECVAIKAARNCCQLQPDIDAPWRKKAEQGQEQEQGQDEEQSTHHSTRCCELKRLEEAEGGAGGDWLFIEHFVARRNFLIGFSLERCHKK